MFGEELQRANDAISKGEFKEATAILKHCAKIHLSNGHQSGVDLYKGNICKYQKHFNEANAYYREAIRKAAPHTILHDRHLTVQKPYACPVENKRYLAVEAAALGNIGSVLAESGNPSEAKSPLLESMAIYTQLYDLLGQANQAFILGQVELHLGNRAEAKIYLDSALNLYSQLGDQYSVCRVQHVLRFSGPLHSLAGVAIELAYRWRLAMLHRQPNAEQWLHDGIRQQSLGQYTQSLFCFDTAFVLYESSGNVCGQGRALNGIGAVLKDMGLAREAAATLQQALELRRRARDRRGEAVTLTALGPVYADVGEPKKAAEALASCGFHLSEALRPRG